MSIKISAFSFRFSILPIQPNLDMKQSNLISLTTNLASFQPNTTKRKVQPKKNQMFQISILNPIDIRIYNKYPCIPIIISYTTSQKMNILDSQYQPQSQIHQKHAQDSHIHHPYHRNESNNTYTHPEEVGRPTEREEEIVGKDHNKVPTFNIYPYTDASGLRNHHNDQPTHVTYHVGRNPTQTSRLPKYVIIIFAVVVCVLIGLLYWFFKAKNVQPEKVEISKIESQTNLSKRGTLRPLLTNVPKGVIRSQGVMYQCPPPGFIYKDRCMRCPNSAIWNGTNCVVVRKGLEGKIVS